jgi:dihydrofolate synthase/folylpolyglutamate synthase
VSGERTGEEKANGSVCSVEETWEYVSGLERLGTRLGLERITKLVEALGDPHKAYRTIHVVGTNGKSSTTRFISSLLEAQCLRVGAYVSPHLVSLAERQMVDSTPSTEAEFCDLVARVRPVVEELERTFPDGEHLTQFEVLTAVALLYFRERGCEVAVIEAGLGGRLDATAVIASEVQVLTSVGREHTELLGETLSAILYEKAAVIPPKGQVVAGWLDPELKAELKVICGGRNAVCHFLGDEVVILTDPRAESFDVFGVYGCYTDLHLRVLGGYQRANAAVAVAAVELFIGRELDPGSVREALAATAVPGRLEVIGTQPLCIFDGSHNPPGMAETVASLDHILERRRLIAVVSILRDKEASEMMRHLAPRCDIIFATQSSSPRALTAEELAGVISGLGKGPEVFVDPDPHSAMVSAYRLATSNQVILVTGSLTLISDLKVELS